jgi:hypothetical protein
MLHVLVPAIDTRNSGHYIELGNDTSGSLRGLWKAGLGLVEPTKK